jgi:hypothetical protein
VTPIRIVLTFLTVLACVNAAAVEILDATVEKRDGVYYVVGTSIVQASPEFIFTTLMDMDHFYKITGGIKDTHFVPSDQPDELLAYTLIESCVLFFCRSAEKVDRMETDPYTEIRTFAIPERSDFTQHTARWILEPADDGTHLTYKAEFKPDFWMPPLISEWAIKRKLLETGEQIGIRIEYLAQRGLTLAQVQESEDE